MSKKFNSITIKVFGDTHNQIDTPVKYINSLVDQIEEDVYPLLFFTKGHAPFTVLRNLFCFLEHTARLRYGNDDGKLYQLFTRNNPKSKRKFNDEQFGTYEHIQKRYFDVHQFLIQMYRNELIHHIRPFPKYIPFEVRNSKNIVITAGIQEIGFFISSNINSKLLNKDISSFNEVYEFMKVKNNRTDFTHLRSVQDLETKEYKCFVFNVLCFMVDIVHYLKNYADLLDKKYEKQVEFIDNFKSIVNDNLTKPNTTIVLDKSRITQTDPDESETDASNEDIEDWYEKMRTQLYKNFGE
jgi:hypothetical protein